MTSLQDIEMAVQKLPAGDLAAFREWFLRFDGQAWDDAIEQDVRNGKLNALADEARQAAARGEATPL